MSPLDWSRLAARLGIAGEAASSEQARAAIALLLGDEVLKSAVDCYLAGAPGSELARHVLWQLRPGAAMAYCREVAQSHANEDVRTTAVELLRVVADARVLAWVPEFLDSDVAGIAYWGILILDQLLQSGLVDEQDLVPLIELGERHANAQVRDEAARLCALLNG